MATRTQWPQYGMPIGAHDGFEEVGAVGNVEVDGELSAQINALNVHLAKEQTECINVDEINK